MKMQCYGCNARQAFTNVGADGYSCNACGWLQDSESAACAELCQCATWHDAQSYQAMATLARAGGHTVPDVAPNRTY